MVPLQLITKKQENVSCVRFILPNGTIPCLLKSSSNYAANEHCCTINEINSKFSLASSQVSKYSLFDASQNTMHDKQRQGLFIHWGNIDENIQGQVLLSPDVSPLPLYHLSSFSVCIKICMRRRCVLIGASPVLATACQPPIGAPYSVLCPRLRLHSAVEPIRHGNHGEMFSPI